MLKLTFVIMGEYINGTSVVKIISKIKSIALVTVMSHHC